MHELSISNAIAKVVLEHAAGRSVESVQVTVGALRQIVPDTLVFCWDVISRQPLLGGSRLEIEQVPAVVECADCATRSTLTEFVLRCPACGSGPVTVVSGEEFLVTSIEVSSDGDSLDGDSLDGAPDRRTAKE